MDMIRPHVEWIAPMEVMAGEFEMEALAAAACACCAAKKKRTISFGIDKCAVNCCRSPLPITLNADAVSVQRTDG